MARIARRHFVAGSAVALAGVGLLLRRRLVNRLSRWTRLAASTAAPPLLPHDPVSDRSTLYVARDGTPAENVDTILNQLGGIEAIVGPNDVVLARQASVDAAQRCRLSPQLQPR